MMDWMCQDLQITNQVLNHDICSLSRLVNKLLMRVTVLEGTQGNPIEIPDSPALIPIPPPGGNLLVEIVDGTNDKAAQAAAEDQVEGQMLQVTGEEARVLGVEGEIFEEGKDILDILRRVVARNQEIPRYPEPPQYNDPNYIPDRCYGPRPGLRQISLQERITTLDTSGALCRFGTEGRDKELAY